MLVPWEEGGWHARGPGRTPRTVLTVTWRSSRQRARAVYQGNPRGCGAPTENSPWGMGAFGCSHTRVLNPWGQRGNLAHRHCGLRGLSPIRPLGAVFPHPGPTLAVKHRVLAPGRGIGWEWDRDGNGVRAGRGWEQGKLSSVLFGRQSCVAPGRGCRAGAYEPEGCRAGLRKSSAWSLRPFSQAPHRHDCWLWARAPLLTHTAGWASLRGIPPL